MQKLTNTEQGEAHPHHLHLPLPPIHQSIHKSIHHPSTPDSRPTSNGPREDCGPPVLETRRCNAASSISSKYVAGSVAPWACACACLELLMTVFFVELFENAHRNIIRFRTPRSHETHPRIFPALSEGTLCWILFFSIFLHLLFLVVSTSSWTNLPSLCFCRLLQ